MLSRELPVLPFVSSRELKDNAGGQRRSPALLAVVESLRRPRDLLREHPQLPGYRLSVRPVKYPHSRIGAILAHVADVGRGVAFGAAGS